MCISLNVFGHHADPVVHHLEKAASNNKTTDGVAMAHRQSTVTQECHERGVVRQDTNLAIERGCSDGVRAPVEHRRLGRDYRDLHHEVAH